MLSKRVGYLTTNPALSPFFEVRLLKDYPPSICIVPCEFARVCSFRAKRGGACSRSTGRGEGRLATAFKTRARSIDVIGSRSAAR